MIAKSTLKQSRKRYMRDQKRKIVRTRALFREGDRILLHNDQNQINWMTNG